MPKMRVFVASPGEVANERTTVSRVVEELRRFWCELADLELETIRWETHTRPAIGLDGQDVINRQIGEYDIFVGIMWRRFGTPTQRAKSGTAEEFQIAFESYKTHKKPQIMFYFRTTPFFPKSIDEIDQFRKIAEFKNEISKMGVYISEYKRPTDFERLFREHLNQHLLSWFQFAHNK